MSSEYLPGPGLAIVVEGAAVLLPEGGGPALVADLWASMRSAAGLTDHLQVLLGGGLAAAPAFALVELRDGVAHAVVRGSARVEVDAAEGTTVVDAALVSTWAEATVGQAGAVRLLGAGASGPALPVHAAVVPAGEVRLGVGAGPRAGAPESARVLPAPVAPAAPPVPVAPAAPPAPVAPAVVRPEPVQPAPVAPPVPAADLVELEHTPVPVWEPVLPVRAEQLAERQAAAAPVRVPAGPPAESVVPVRAAQVPEDHDGLTVLSSDMVALRRQLPDWAGDAVPQLSVPTPRSKAPAKLQMSTGLVVSLNRPVLLGRAPQVTRVGDGEIPRLITVASPNQDISRTHCEVRMDGDDVVITDLRSTNGVLLLRQGQGAQRLHPGEPTVVEPGVVVDLGEGVTFLVEAGG